MQSTDKVIIQLPFCDGPFQAAQDKKPACCMRAFEHRFNVAAKQLRQESSLGLVLQNLTATVKTVGADVVTQVHFTGVGFYGDAGHIECVVRTVHAALRRRFFVLLNGHDWLL
jgi:hypothetical protein